MITPKKIVFFTIGCILAAIGSVYIAVMLDNILVNNTVVSSFDIQYLLDNEKAGQLYLNIFLCCVVFLCVVTFISADKSSNSVETIVPNVKTPVHSGRNEFGSARWQTTREKKKSYLISTIRYGIRDSILYLIYKPLNNVPFFNKLPKIGKHIKDFVVNYETVNYLIKMAKKESTEEKSTETNPSLNEQSTAICDVQLFKKGGVILGKTDKFKKSNSYYVMDNDTHIMCLGATRSGKSRTVVLPSIAMLALAGESMFMTDPKGELYLYTYPFLKSLGYEVVALDFSEPYKSTRYNPLQPVINAVEDNDIPLAIQYTRDIVNALVDDSGNTEAIWKDGQRAVMVCSIISVVYDNRAKERQKYQNLTNVYHFIAQMCKPINDKGDVLMSRYISKLVKEQGNHPALLCKEVAELAPDKMRASFYASAMTCFELFTDINIYGMTKATDFDIYTTGVNKRAIFIILPDERSTYYPVAALLIYQQYQTLVEVSKKYGNRLPRRVNFLEDEKGNFTKLTDYSKLITVGGGRGIRFNLFLQDFEQLDDVYNDKQSSVIRSNCETWIYLKSDNGKTIDELSNKLGKYTIASYSNSSSSNGGSSSYSYTGRSLLEPNEIRQINRPYQLITSRNFPAIMYAPDISQTVFNKFFGLGNPEHNTALLLRRSKNRVGKKLRLEDMELRSAEDYFGGIDPLESPKPPEKPKPNKIPIRENRRKNEFSSHKAEDISTEE